MKTWMKVLGYFGVGVFFFILFLYFTFPDEALKNYLLNQIEDGMGGKYRIKVSSMSSGIVFGLSFKNVEITRRDSDTPAIFFKSSKVNINPSIIAFLRKINKFSFSIVFGKGELSGNYYDSATENDIQLEFDKLNLKDINLSSELAIFNYLKGVLDGNFEVKFFAKDPSKNKGLIDVKLADFVITSFKTRMDPTSSESEIEIPEIKLSTSKNSKLVADFNKTDLNIKQFVFSGGDIEINVNGQIHLAQKVNDYQLDLRGNIKINSEAVKKVPLLALFEQQKQADGTYPFTLTGRLMKPSISVGAFRLPF